MRILVAATLAALVLLAGGAQLTERTSADSKFGPTTTVRLCNALPTPFVDGALNGNPACAENLANSATANTSITMTQAATDLNFVTEVTFIPSTVTTTAGGSMPVGTEVGGVHSAATLGFINGACNSASTNDFVLYNIALPNNPGSPLSSTNLAYPQAQGTVDRFAGWSVGVTASGPGGISPGVDTGHAGPTSIPIQDYPRYLLDAFGNQIPRAAYGGLTLVQNEWQPLYLLQFSAGQLASRPAPYSLMNANMGQPLVWVYGDPTATLPSPSSVTDNCAPGQTTVMLLGKDPTNTYTRASSPAPAATAYYMQYLASDRDLDQDGFENSLDTCPKNRDTGSPKTGTGDADGDGVDDVCDPDFTPFPPDSDLDGYVNRQDNCPEVVNTTQADSETTTPSDLGPKPDHIGDACDTGVVSVTQNNQTFNITLSTTVANGRYMTVTNTVPKCFGGTDADGDGYCTTDDSADSGTVCTSTTPNPCFFRHTGWTGAALPMLQMDTDGDTVAPFGGGGTANFSDAVETYLGTDPTKPCAQTVSINDEGLPTGNLGIRDNWPADLDDNRLVNLQDIGKFTPLLAPGFRAVNQGGDGNGTATSVATESVVPFSGVLSGSGLGPILQTRFDINMDGFLNVQDTGKLSPYYGRPCGMSGAPPITLGGTFQQ